MSSGASDREHLSPVDRVFLTLFDCLAFVSNSLKSIQGGNRIVKRCLNSSHFKQIFDDADADGNGTLNREEMYTLVLRFYLMVAQYTTVVARHIPTRADVENVMTQNDEEFVDENGEVGFEEFKHVVLLLCEGVATQLVAQLIFTVFLSPLLALCILSLLRSLFDTFPILLKEFWFVPNFLWNDKVGVLVLVPLLNFLISPYYLEYIFHIQSLRNPSKVRFVPDMSQFQPVSSTLKVFRDNYDIDVDKKKED